MLQRHLAVLVAFAFLAGCASGRKGSRSSEGREQSAREAAQEDAAAARGTDEKGPPRPRERPAPSGLVCTAKYRKGTLDVPKSELEGTASFYAKQYHGKQTASGELFDMNAMSAAHRTLLLGTKVRVTNLDNGRQVEVCINDRGPYAKDRILDLSYAAAKELGIINDGEGPVRIEILDRK